MQIYLICPKLDASSPVMGVLGLFSDIARNYFVKIKFFEFSLKSGSNNKLFRESFGFSQMTFESILRTLFCSVSPQRICVSFCFRADLLAFFLKAMGSNWVALVRCDVFTLYEIESRLGRIKKRIHLSILRKADRVLVPSMYLKSKFIESGFSNVVCAGSAEYSDPLKVDHSASQSESKRKVVGYFGGDLHNKGIDLILKCIREMDESDVVIDVSFIIGGRFYDERVVRLFESNSRVRFVGFCEIDRYLREIDVLIIPSYSEGSPRLGLEALARDIPFIFRKDIGLDELWSSQELAANFAFIDDDEIMSVLIRVLRSLESLYPKRDLLNAFYSPKGHASLVWAILSELESDED